MDGWRAVADRWRLTVSARLSAFSFWSLRACCRARISVLCSFTASSTAWRDSELRCSERSLREKEEGRGSSSIIAHFAEKLLHQQQGEVLISVGLRVTTSSVFYQLPSPPRLHQLRKYPHISQNTFGGTLENLPKLLRVCGQKLRG